MVWFSSTGYPAWKPGTVVTDRVLTQNETMRMVIDQKQFDDIRTAIRNNVTSTTIPRKPHQASSNRGDVVTDINGNKAVAIELKDGSTKMIPYDQRGLAIFDDVVSFTTKIDDSKPYTGQMGQASKDMWEVIKSDPAAKSKFSSKQLSQIQSGSKQIDGYTWHHNPQSSPSNMQLIPYDIHKSKSVPHTGQNSLKDGK